MGKNIIRAMVCIGLLAGCASAPPTNRSLESTTATIRAAEELGAGRSPRAAVHLQLARDEAERARALYQEGHPGAGRLPAHEGGR